MRLAHTMIRIKDVDETLAFYRDFIGLRELKRKEIGDEATLIFLSDADENYILELTHNRGKDDYTLGDQFGHLAFAVNDLDNVITEVEKRGWWYRRSRPELSSKYIFVKDPNGYDVELIQY